MAIDLMIMPLSRFWSGNFVTPMMREAWDSNIPYRIVRPNGPMQEFPPGVPYGGEDAPTRHKELIDLGKRYVASLPEELAKHPWDEASEAEPAFFRLESESFGCLLKEAVSKLGTRPSFFKRLSGQKQRILHITTATVFFPQSFPEVLELDKKHIGSLVSVKEELNSVPESETLEPSLGIYKQAVYTALGLHLPMIVDL